LPPDQHEILKSYLRLFVGVLKIVVLSTLFERGSSLFLGKLEAGGGAANGLGLKAVGYFVVMIYCYFFFLYMNFSGYCDVVIAGASLVGLKLPENFNMPLLARNILDHWTRWHITLGHWIRDYLFTPLYKAGVERFAARSLSVAVLSYLVAFTFAGFWHGSTGNFAVFGLLHGLGASAAKLWESLIIRRSGRPGLRAYLKSTPIRVVATLMTFHYVCFALLFWSMDLNRAWKILTIVFRSVIPTY
jgi:D-alanyl-lipoteichoic acid acyltransferase DltB (MBOAT superfamily)